MSRSCKHHPSGGGGRQLEAWVSRHLVPGRLFSTLVSRAWWLFRLLKRSHSQRLSALLSGQVKPQQALALDMNDELQVLNSCCTTVCNLREVVNVMPRPLRDPLQDLGCKARGPPGHTKADFSCYGRCFWVLHHHLPWRVGSLVPPSRAEDLQLQAGRTMAQVSRATQPRLAGIQAFPSTAAHQSPSEMFNEGQCLNWECSAGRAISPTCTKLWSYW